MTSREDGDGGAASQSRIALVTWDEQGKKAAQRIEPLLRLVFPGIWFPVTTFSPQQDGDLKRHGRRVRADGLIVGPASPSQNPAEDWSFSVGGSVFGWAVPRPAAQPLWLLSAGRGELHDGLELPSIPRSLRRRSRRLRQRRALGPAAVVALDPRSLELCGRIAAELAVTATTPVSLAYPAQSWPALFREWRAAVARGLGDDLATACQLIAPEKAAYLLAAKDCGSAPEVTITTNLIAGTLAGILAGHHSPALVPRLLCGPKLRAAQVGHSVPRDGADLGPTGLLAAAAAVMFLLGRRAQASNLLRILQEIVADPETGPIEAGGVGTAERTLEILHDRVMRQVVPLSSGQDIGSGFAVPEDRPE